MTQRYPSKTLVSSDRSKAEIEGILRRYGAKQFMQGWEPGLGVGCSRINGFQVRMLLPLSNPEDFRHYERKSGDSTRQMALDGDTLAIATVLPSRARPVSGGDMTHARPMEITA